MKWGLCPQTPGICRFGRSQYIIRSGRHMEPSISGLGPHGARVASPQSPILRVTWALHHVWKQLPKIVYTKLLTLPCGCTVASCTFARINACCSAGCSACRNSATGRVADFWGEAGEFQRRSDLRLYSTGTLDHWPLAGEYLPGERFAWQRSADLDRLLD